MAFQTSIPSKNWSNYLRETVSYTSEFLQDFIMNIRNSIWGCGWDRECTFQIVHEPISLRQALLSCCSITKNYPMESRHRKSLSSSQIEKWLPQPGDTRIRTWANSLRYVLECIVTSFQVRWKWIKVKIWNEWGLKVDEYYKMTTKRFPT